MGCCVCDDHDYCCRCYDERAVAVVTDVLDGSYSGEVDVPSGPSLSPDDAAQLGRAIVEVLTHEGII